jgi:hypothetical protein
MIETPTFCRHIDRYDESYDKISTKIAKNLRRFEKLFYDVTTSEDPILERLAVDASNMGDVYATGAITLTCVSSLLIFMHYDQMESSPNSWPPRAPSIAGTSSSRR